MFAKNCLNKPKKQSPAPQSAGLLFFFIFYVDKIDINMLDYNDFSLYSRQNYHI